MKIRKEEITSELRFKLGLNAKETNIYTRGFILT